MAGNTYWLLLFVLGMVLVDRADGKLVGTATHDRILFIRAAAGDSPLYVVVTVCVIYVIVDVVLFVALVLWLWKTRS